MSRFAEFTASMREAQHLMLTRPCDRRIEQAVDTDSERQPSIYNGLDEAWREEGQRDRHSARRHPTGPSRRRDQAAGRSLRMALRSKALSWLDLTESELA